GSDSTDTGETGRPTRLLVTADWRAKRLSLVDYELLREGAQTREQALWRTIELPQWEPGPLEVELTPDASKAVVSIAPGFFAGAGGSLVGAGPGTVPEGGALLVVEVDTGMVLAEIATAHYPMGIVVNADGSEAWTANYGGNGQSGMTMSHVDLVDYSLIEELEIGPGPEQLALRGDLAIINTAGDGSVRLFDITADPLASLSPALAVSSDSSGVLFVDDGSDRAVVVNSGGPPGYSLLDVADPGAPALIETVPVAGVAYAGVRGQQADELLLSVLTGTAIALQRYDLNDGALIEQIEVPVIGLPLGLAYDADDQLALCPVPGHNALVVADFSIGDHRIIDWQDLPGPTHLSLR
ncbi:MAG: hypothetical protein KC457_16670, partial [Myxococcales bacterium]|nr:hypothetical protein [Myxococcales bacterium]